MGLFGFGKKDVAFDPIKEFGNTQTSTGFNNQDPMNSNFNSQPIGTDPMLDSNSGLRLAELNNTPQNQDFGFSAQPSQGGIDSFGNPKPQMKSDNYEYKTPQYQTTDNSKDLQIIIAKLDAIRSEITNINHRLDNIERHQQETPQKKYPW
ncbi:MAG: hypothetical protein WC758_01855 [Candidatus Woesearchaeota archaeon]|jgi:hypothetical protein